MRDFTFICAAPSLAPNKICRMWVVLADKQRERERKNEEKKERGKEGRAKESVLRSSAGRATRFTPILRTASRAPCSRSPFPVAERASELLMLARRPACSRRARARPKSVWSQAMQLLPEDELTQSARVISKTRARSSLNNQRDRERRRRKLCE